VTKHSPVKGTLQAPLCLCNNLSRSDRGLLLCCAGRQQGRLQGPAGVGAAIPHTNKSKCTHCSCQSRDPVVNMHYASCFC
jgi:hypothetical protein